MKRRFEAMLVDGEGREGAIGEPRGNQAGQGEGGSGEKPELSSSRDVSRVKRVRHDVATASHVGRRTGVAGAVGGGGTVGESSDMSEGAVEEAGSWTRSCDSSSSSSSSSPHVGESSIDMQISRQVRRKLAKAGENPKTPVFTTEDVKEIALHSMKEREAKLREEYSVQLNDRLAEQFQSFSKYNHDFLFSVYREPQKTYVS